MAEISETEINKLTKSQNYIRGYYDGKSDTLDRIRAEIEEIEKNYGFDKATKYGNKNAEQQSLSYSTMMMYEIANIIDEIKEIIDKYKAESADT